MQIDHPGSRPLHHQLPSLGAVLTRWHIYSKSLEALSARRSIIRSVFIPFVLWGAAGLACGLATIRLLALFSLRIRSDRTIIRAALRITSAVCLSI